MCGSKTKDVVLHLEDTYIYIYKIHIDGHVEDCAAEGDTYTESGYGEYGNASPVLSISVSIFASHLLLKSNSKHDQLSSLVSVKKKLSPEHPAGSAWPFIGLP